jgi:hypothetical protein
LGRGFRSSEGTLRELVGSRWLGSAMRREGSRGAFGVTLCVCVKTPGFWSGAELYCAVPHDWGAFFLF